MDPVEFSRIVDETGLIGYHAVLAAAFEADFEALPADPVEDLLPALLGRLGGEPVEFWVGSVDGHPVSSTTIRYSDHENLDLAMISVDVHPAARRRGYARRATEQALDRVRDLGRTRVLGQVPTRTRRVDPAPARGLARAFGARPLHSERRRLLRIADLSSAGLASLVDEAESCAAGYSVVTWRDHTPAEYVADMAALMGLMSTDPPQGELEMEAEVWTQERYLEHESSVLDRGRRRIVAAAREVSSGRVVGFTDLASPPGDVDVGFQWATIVRDEHRGHRLGLLMKATNLQRMLVDLPHLRYLNTWNADVNTHMVSVNERLGYQPMEAWEEWGLSLELSR